MSEYLRKTIRGARCASAHARRRAHLAALLATLGLLALVPAIPSATASRHARSARARMDGLELRVLRGVNRQRAAAGLAPLAPSVRLARAADAHSGDMAGRGFLSHASSNGTSFQSRVGRYVHARALGETIASMSPRSSAALAHSVLQAWMNSPPHRAILLAPSLRRIGIGARRGRLGGLPTVFFTADFSTPG